MARRARLRRTGVPGCRRIFSVADQIPTREEQHKYQANVFHCFDVANDKPVVVLDGEESDSNIAFSGDGWKSSPFGALDYTRHPRDTVECGSYSNPDLGCKDEDADSAAAYAQALLWYITGNKAYAENTVKIMNAWSSTLAGGHTNANGPVQAS